MRAGKCGFGAIVGEGPWTWECLVPQTEYKKWKAESLRLLQGFCINNSGDRRWARSFAFICFQMLELRPKECK